MYAGLNIHNSGSEPAMRGAAESTDKGLQLRQEPAAVGGPRLMTDVPDSRAKNGCADRSVTGGPICFQWTKFGDGYCWASGIHL